MQTNDTAVAATINRLKGLPGVSAVVGTGWANSAHDHTPGHVTYTSTVQKGISARVYGRGGIQTVIIETKDPLGLRGRLVPPPANRREVTPLPPDARIARGARNAEPVYPAEPAPLKPADPVADTLIKGRLVSVTPDIAVNWLERNTHNRRLKDSVVDMYAGDMKAGLWRAGGSIIKFDTNGNILNGQHVLWAVVNSGCTIDLYVLSGVDESVFLVEDNHARRTVMDTVRIGSPGTSISVRHAGVATMLRWSIGWAQGRISESRVSRQAEIAFLETHRESIDAAVKMFQKGDRRGICVSPVMAPVARAWHTVDRAVLERFAAVVQTGLVQDPNENPAVLLRNYLLANIGLATGSRPVKQATYQRVERAMVAFIKKERLQILKPVSTEQFPLPGERVRRAKEE